MEKSKCIFLILFCLGFTFVYGQNKSIYDAYKSGDMLAWQSTMNAIEPKTDAEILALINYQYGYTAWCIGQKRDDEAKKYLDSAQSLVKKLEKKDYHTSTLWAYKAAFVGFEIGIDPHRAPFIGLRSLAFAKQSTKADPSNYFAYLQLGNSAFYTPKVFGGSKKDAIGYYLHALELIEKDAQLLRDNWNYLNLLATIINAYYEMGDYERAQTYCTKALSVAPDFSWVKHTLYPKIRKEQIR